MITVDFTRVSRISGARGRLLGRTALCGVISLGLAATLAPRPAKAGPEGGNVVQGSATIQSTGSHTEITQTTQKALLTWQDFSIGSAESVNFAQPGTDAVALNRVLSRIPSDIQGQLTANGQVWIINPNGVFVGRDAAINVGGLLASTAQISDQQFEAGDYSFAGAPAGSQIVNQGSITANGGSIVLVAPIVDSSGSLTAQGGDVALGAGSGFTVDFHGDGLTRFAVDPAAGARLNVSGTVSAQGGAAYLVGAASDAVQESVVSIGGQVEATRIEDRGGVIVISGGETGVTEVSGTLDAAQDAGAGGRVVVTGDRVAVRGTAAIDASGATDGGTVEIGGGFQGGALASDVVAMGGAPAAAPLPTAKRTLVERGARIAADAGGTGDGGTVIVWADEATGFYGSLSATGGAVAGNGGFAEVSGKHDLAFHGDFDLTAPTGATGELLLDPNNITIQAAGANDAELTDFQILFGDGGAGDFTISAAVLNSATDVTLQATNDVIVNAPVNNVLGGGLTFAADNNVAINQSVTSTGFLDFTANADASGGGSIVMAAATTLSGTDITLSGNAATLNTVMASSDLGITAGSLTRLGGTLTGSGSVTIADAFGATITNADVAGIVTPDFTYSNAGGAITINSALDLSAFPSATLAAPEIDITGGNSVTVGAGTLILRNSAGDGIALGGDESGGATSFTISNDEIDAITAGTFGVATAGGTVTIDAFDPPGPGGPVDPDFSGFDTLSIEAADINITNDVGAIAIGGGTGTFAVTHGQAGGDITLGAAGGLSLSDGELDRIEAETLIATTQTGDIEVDSYVTADAEPHILQLNAPGGGVLFDNDSSGFELIEVTAADVNATGGSGDQVSADAIELTNAEGDTVTLGTNAGGAGVFDLTAAEMNRFDTPSLTVTTAGNIVVDDAQADNATNLALNAGTTIAFNNNASSFDNNLELSPTTGITQTAELVVGGTTQINAVGQAVTLDHGSNDFGGPVNATALNLTLNDTDTIELGAVTVTGTLSVEADEAITQTTDGISVAGATILNATEPDGAITLTDTGNDFDSDETGDTITVLGGHDVHIVNQDAIVLGNVTATGDLTVEAQGSGTITQALLTAVSATGGTTNLVADGNDIALLNTGNDFSEVDATGANVSLYDTNAIVLDDLTVTGNLAVTAEGSITDADGTIDVAGTTNLLAREGIGPIFDYFDIALDNGNHDFDSDGSGDGLTAEGEDITLSEAGDLVLGAITLHAGDAAADATVAGNTGALSATATGDGDITQTAALSVPGAATFTAQGNDVTLVNPSNAFSGAVNADADNVNLRSNTTLTLGDVDAAGDLDVLALSIADGAETAAGSDVNVAGTTILAAPGPITVDDATNDFTGAVTLVSLDDVSIADSNAITLADIDIAGGNLTVAAATTIDDGAQGDNESVFLIAGPDITVSGTSTLTAGTSITLDDLTNDFGGAVSASAPTVLVNDANILTVGTVNAATSATFGAVGDINVAGLVTSPGTTLIDRSGNGIALSGGGALLETFQISDADTDFIAGDLTLQTTGNIIVAAATFDDSNAATSRTVTLDAGGPVTFGDPASIVPTTSTFEAGLDIVASSVSQTALEEVVVAGAMSIDTAGAVDLDNVVNDFDGTVTVSGGNISLFDADSLVLGAVTATGTLTALAFGPIADSGAGVTVTGTSTLASLSSITLDDAVNDFGGAVSAFGTNISLGDANALTLADIDASGSLTVNAATSIDDGGSSGIAGSDVNVSGATILTAGTTITLDDATNDFVGPVSADGTVVSLRDANDVTVGDIEAGTLTAQAGTFIFDSGTATPGAGVDVTGTTTLIAGAGFNVLIDDAVNDFGGTVDASGANISIRDVNNLELGDIDATASLTARAGGSLTDNGDGAAPGTDVNVTGTTTLTADAGDITLDDAFNDFVGPVSATGGNVTLNDVSALQLGAVDAAADLVVATNGPITDTPGEAITVDGATTLTAGTGGAFFDIVLDNPGTPTLISAAGTAPAPPLHDFNAVTATGEDIVIRDIDDITIVALRGSGAGGSDATQGAFNVTIDKGTTQDLTLTVEGGGSVVVQSDGLMTINEVDADGDILLVTGTDFHLIQDTTDGLTPVGLPLVAGSDLTLVALDGTFIDPDELATATDPEAAFLFPGATTLRAETGNIAIFVNDAFKVVLDGSNPPFPAGTTGAPAPEDNNGLVLDINCPSIPCGNVAVISIADGEIGIGSQSLIDQILERKDAFNPFTAVGALQGNGEIFVVTGNLGLESRANSALDQIASFFVENTSAAANAGAGTRVDGETFIGGTFENIGLFGSFNGTPGQVAAVQGFNTTDTGRLIGPGRDLVAAFDGFVPNPNLTANGCIIGILSSCQPIGRTILILEIQDGALLAFKFFDEEEEEDDQFSNRGDEEDWE